MEKSGQMNQQEIKIQGLLDRYLVSRSNISEKVISHPDDDMIAAFAEGNLSEREATPLIRHFVDCSFCRHISAELVRLEFELADETAQSATIQNATEPAKISAVLSNLFTKIFGTSDGAVFAHHEDEKKDEKEAEKEEE